MLGEVKWWVVHIPFFYNKYYDGISLDGDVYSLFSSYQYYLYYYEDDACFCKRILLIAAPLSFRFTTFVLSWNVALMYNDVSCEDPLPRSLEL